MSRWNISHLVYYSTHNEKRIIEFNVGDTTIVTGGSNTGKTAIIDTIDYCLGSSSCKIASFVTDRVSHVASKWVNDKTEILIAREIGTTKTISDRMFIEYGSNILIPESATDLKGAATKEQVKLVIERLFGFQNELEATKTSGKVSIRNITPFIFLDKDVIDSKKTLMHGLDDIFFSKSIIESLPFFLGAIDAEELDAIKTMNGLSKGIENEEKKKIQFEGHENSLIDKCRSLLSEASQFGLIPPESIPDTKDEMIKLLTVISLQEPKVVVQENENIVKELQTRKTVILSELNGLRRKKNAATQVNTVTTDFDKILDKQLAKLDVRKYFKHEETHCPVCNNLFTTPSDLAIQIENSITTLEKERTVIRNHKPAVSAFIRETEEQIQNAQIRLAGIETEVVNLLKESEVLKKQFDDNQQATRIIGRISYFLDNHTEVSAFDSERLDRYTRELNELKKRYGKSHREERIQLAENSISRYATENLSVLPTGFPATNATINFLSKTPKIIITDVENVKREFANVGSDENYLSIHLAFAFAFQKFFRLEKSPVPGVLILDQVSRPYYSNETKEEGNRQEEEIADDETDLHKHFDFIFNQVASEHGLQVIVIEHAYLKNDPRFVTATKYRWPKNGQEKLIPSDWPTKNNF
ncbi:hypothetical protein DCC81_14530 [Chitinophaga parva]|uniref:DUF3732 domain-containing protein n=1 Tax=Chitinophaga parva TaxID=2169414 RepID=A0A2T7BGT6_9BACT|nr:DUF3732 domain-containing protein [Chitinophaga parva]PUZ25497.1 hypothetical protein DCC81_14530 [Chitinophaga parva]